MTKHLLDAAFSMNFLQHSVSSFSDFYSVWKNKKRFSKLSALIFTILKSNELVFTDGVFLIADFISQTVLDTRFQSVLNKSKALIGKELSKNWIEMEHSGCLGGDGLSVNSHRYMCFTHYKRCVSAKISYMASEMPLK